MKLSRRSCGVTFAAGVAALGILAGCAGQSTFTDAPVIASDSPGAARVAAVIELIATGEEALERARQHIPTAVLRQVDFGSEPGMLIFRYTDATATRTLTITFTALRSANEQWQAIEEGLTPFTGHTHPGMEIGALRTSPAAVRQAAIDNWPVCGPTGFTLGGPGSDLKWHVACVIEAGSVSSTLDDSTGIFTPSPAPPVRPATTAFPNRG